MNSSFYATFRLVLVFFLSFYFTIIQLQAQDLDWLHADIYESEFSIQGDSLVWKSCTSTTCYRWRIHLNDISVYLAELSDYDKKYNKIKLILECADSACIYSERIPKKGSFLKWEAFDYGNTFHFELRKDNVRSDYKKYRLVRKFNDLNPKNKNLSLSEISEENAWLDEVGQKFLEPDSNSSPLKELMSFNGLMMDFEFHNDGSYEAIYHEKGKGVLYYNSSNNNSIVLTNETPAASTSSSRSYNNIFHIPKNGDELMFFTTKGNLIKFDKKTGKTISKSTSLNFQYANFGPGAEFALLDGDERYIYDLGKMDLILKSKEPTLLIAFGADAKAFSIIKGKNLKFQAYSLPDGNKLKNVETIGENYKPVLFPESTKSYSFSHGEYDTITISNKNNGQLGYNRIRVSSRNKVRDSTIQHLQFPFVTDIMSIFKTKREDLFAILVWQKENGKTTVYVPNEMDAYFKKVLPKIETSNCIAGNCNDGMGKWQFEDGRIYEGQMKNLKPDGDGIMFWDGLFFKGKFKNGVMHGRYEVRDIKGDKVQHDYLDIINGDKHGVCKGEFNDCYNGRGTLILNDTVTITANFSDGNPVGYASIINGDEEYEKFYERPYFDGRMIFKKPNGEQEIRIYDKGKLYAVCVDNCWLQGTLRFSETATYSGHLDEKGKPNGYGTYVNGKKLKITGRWVHGKAVEITQTDEFGNKFEGSLSKSNRPEKGTWFDKDGKTTWCCTYDEWGAPHGKGTVRRYVRGTDQFRSALVTMEHGKVVEE